MVIMRFIMTVSLVILLASLSGCGKVREASQMVNAAKNAVDTAKNMSEGLDSGDIDLDNIDLSEKDIRTFYTGIAKLNKAYPDISFEIALTAALEISTRGKNLEKIVEKETNMSFQEYSALSMAIMVIQTEGAGVLLAEDMLTAMEEGMTQFDDMDTSEFTEEQLAGIENQRQAVVEARNDLETSEYKEQKERLEMVNAIREELLE